MLAWFTEHWLFVAFLSLTLVGIGTIFFSRWEKAGPNEVLIVSGRPFLYVAADGSKHSKGFTIIHGGWTFVRPWEKVDRMPLELMTLEILTPEFYTKFGVPIIVDGIAQIKIRSDDLVSTATATEMFLSKDRKELNEIAHQMMAGHLRGAISTLSFEEILSQPEAFAARVQQLTAEDLGNMGIQVVSFTIREIQDPSSYIKALGRPKQAEVEKNAILGEAMATRDATIGKAEAERESTITATKAEQESQLARLATDVAIAEAKKNKEVSLHEFNAQMARAKAESDMAYELQRAKTKQLVVDEEMGVSLIEKRKRAEIEQSEIDRRTLELVHTIEAPAEAERKKIQTLTAAEGQRLRMLAEAEADAVRLKGLAEADSIRARGLAEAEAVRMKILAEAEGMQAKALAWQQYSSAALGQMLIEKLPDIVAAVAAPLQKIDRIVMINNGQADSSGVERVTQGVTEVLGQVPGLVEMLSGLNLRDLVNRLPGQNAPPPPPPMEKA